MVLQGNSLWHQVLTNKDMNNKSIVSWLRDKNFTVRGASVIWNGFLHTLSWLGKCLAWHVGNGQNIVVGVDPIIGTHSLSDLPLGLRDYLKDFGIVSLNHAQNTLPGLHKYWYTTEDLDIVGEWKLAWDNYIRCLEQGRICLNPFVDSLVWNHNKHNGNVTAELVYDLIVLSTSPLNCSKLHAFLWSCNIPLKIRCFIWLALANKILTWDNL